MRLPDFLIIGAMKSGTTSLYSDLRALPAVFMPEDKEPNALAGDEVLSAAGLRTYSRLFAPSRTDQICGEASTSYSKLPDVAGVPGRARQVLGKDLKVIYLVREPIARAISHHYHELTRGTMEGDIDEAVRMCPRLIDYGRYAMQVEPWLDTFGGDQVRIVRFETYAKERRRVVAGLLEFLGIDVRTDDLEVDRVFNRSDGARAPRGLGWRFSRGSFYRAWIRPWLSRPLRSRLKSFLMPRAPSHPQPPTLATVDYILDKIIEDSTSLQQLTGSDAALWDFESVRSRYTRSSSSSSLLNRSRP